MPAVPAESAPVSHLTAVQTSHLKSPVLVMLASADGLTGVAWSAAEALRQALDEHRPRIARLDALDRCLARLPAVMPEPRALDPLVDELLTVVEPMLRGPRHREMQIRRVTDRIGIEWPLVHTPGWDADSPAGLTELLGHQGTDMLQSAMAPIMKPCWDEPLEQQLHDTEEAAALIRMLGLQVRVTLDTALGRSVQPRLNACARALGLWAAVERRLPTLPTRPGGPAALYGLDALDQHEGDTEATTASATARQALHQACKTARQQAARQVAGHTDIVAALQPAPPAAQPGSTALTWPRSSMADAAIVVARDTSVAASAQALAAHEAVLAEHFAPRARETLRQHTQWVVIDAPIPDIGNKDDRLLLVSYEGLRMPLPLALLPEVVELEARIAQLHAEFPWATRAIEVVAGEMLARRRLGAVSFAWAPILLVGPPGTGKTRLARRLAEIMGLAFLPLDIGGSSDSRLLTGTSRGWANGEPSPILRALRDQRRAQLLVLLDEVDKCSSRTGNAVSIQAALLGLLEPESSRRWIDGYLQVPCDLSKLLFVATANRLGTINAALMSRLQPVLVPTPKRQHYPMIVQQVVRDVASDWGLPPDVMPALDVTGLARAAGSVRELVRLVRQEIVREVCVASAPH